MPRVSLIFLENAFHLRKPRSGFDVFTFEL